MVRPWASRITSHLHSTRTRSCDVHKHGGTLDRVYICSTCSSDAKRRAEKYDCDAKRHIRVPRRRPVAPERRVVDRCALLYVAYTSTVGT